MGLGNFRVRILVALAMVLVIWQSIRIWSSATDDSLKEIRMKEDAEEEMKNSKFQRVLIMVYYEALCPDSRSFVFKQLKPAYEALKEHIEIEMVPYGKATTTKTYTGYEFTCQHGPIECEANMIHACSIAAIKDPTLRLDFLVCMIRNNLNPQNITRTCAEKLQLDSKPIFDCLMDSRGEELLAMYGRMTEELRPRVSFIPTITLDKNSDNQPAILKNLLHEICQLYKVLPDGCAQ